MVVRARLERDGAVGRGRASAELSCLADRTHGQLGAADASWEAEVVLDPPRRPGLAAERVAVNDQGVQPLGRAVDGRSETGRAAADDKQVDGLHLAEVE